MIVRLNAYIGIDKEEQKSYFGTALYRVVALTAIATLGVQENQRGGWCSEEAVVGQSVQWVAERSTFVRGTFEGGTFVRGTFKGGTFVRGTFKGGTFVRGTFEGGTFEGGTFEGGTFKGGTFWGGTFKGGTFVRGTFKGGTFWGGTFKGGTFEGGTFEGGTFWGGTFWGGTFKGGTFRFAVTAQRSDGYVFTLNYDNDTIMVAAGCRYFTFEEARAHWLRTRGGTQLGEESQALLDHLEKMAAITKFAETQKEEAAL